MGENKIPPSWSENPSPREGSQDEEAPEKEKLDIRGAGQIPHEHGIVARAADLCIFSAFGICKETFVPLKRFGVHCFLVLISSQHYLLFWVALCCFKCNKAGEPQGYVRVHVREKKSWGMLRSWGVEGGHPGVVTRPLREVGETKTAPRSPKTAPRRSKTAQEIWKQKS